MLRKIFSEPAILILSLACGLSIIFLFVSERTKGLLLSKNASLEKKVENLSDLQEGDIVPPIDVLDNQGKERKLVYQEGQKYLLMIFSPDCKACQLQKGAVWNNLASQAKSKGFKIFGVSLGPLEESKKYLKNRNIEFEIMVPAQKIFERAYRIRRIPQVLLINGLGVIKFVHHGTLQEEDLNGLFTQIETLK